MADQIPKANRQIVQGRAFGRCERCHKIELNGDLHHRRVRGIGGSRRTDRHDPSGLLYLCRTCHDWTHNHPFDARDLGLIVSRNSTSRYCDIPVVDLYGRARLLDDEGSWTEVSDA